MMRVYMFLGALAVIGTALGGAYLKGHSDGTRAAEARAAEAVRELNEELRQAELEAQRREQQRLAELAELEGQVEELRRLADEDPDADRPAVGVGSVRRINSID